MKKTCKELRKCLLQTDASLYNSSEELTGLPKTSVHRILTEDLQKRKLCARFVPHVLTSGQKRAGLEHCRDMQVTAAEDSEFLPSIITGDETWCFQYEPSTKRQCAEWRSADDEKLRKPRMQKSRVKKLMTVFFDSKGIIHIEYIIQGRTVNTKYYVGVPRSSTYSPDLAPADFWLFPKLKLAMKGTRHDSIEDIQGVATKFLRAIPKEDFRHCFERFYGQFQRCIESAGDYFE
ncbi:uncharacterized protein LOC135400592 [Ornithodoros turicata]|uniref:uncharacterized protein LOC135400592 n=1 Tax=Ornithodoros turicata TaxID=34597 RepID=UPI003138D17E